MIALIISNDDYSINQISLELKKDGYETIVYRWLTKAMDNIQEIQPNVIVVNCQDYPRHWKVLGSFLNALYPDPESYSPSLILYTGGAFPVEELDKARRIGVKGLFESVSDRGLSELRNYVAKQSNTNASENDLQFIFTNPMTEMYVTGTITDSAGDQFTFIPDILSHASQLEEGMMLRECSLLKNGEVKNVKAQVLSVSDSEPYGLELYLEG